MHPWETLSMWNDAPVEDTGSSVNAHQLRAARAMLGWSLIEASRNMAVSVMTIVTCENAGLDLRNGGRDDMLVAYRAAGIRFLSREAEWFGVSLTEGAHAPS